MLLLAAFIVTVLLLAHAGANAAPRTFSDPARFAGAFVNWGAIGREHTLQQWEKWLNRKPSSVLGVDFYAQSTWDDFAELSWVPGIWRQAQSRRATWCGRCR